MIFFLFYFLLHLAFCTLYLWTLLVGLGGPGGWVGLGLVVGLSSIWAACWLAKFWRVSGSYQTGRQARARTVVVGVGCALGWAITFPLYLTYRQWLKRQAGLPVGHFTPRH